MVVDDPPCSCFVRTTNGEEEDSTPDSDWSVPFPRRFERPRSERQKYHRQSEDRAWIKKLGYHDSIKIGCDSFVYRPQFAQSRTLEQTRFSPQTGEDHDNADFWDTDKMFLASVEYEMSRLEHGTASRYVLICLYAVHDRPLVLDPFNAG